MAQRIKHVNKLDRVHFENVNMMDFKNWDKKYYSQYTSEVFRRLSWAKEGMKMISYHGFGGKTPDSWKLVKGNAMSDGHLCLWEKF